MVRRLAFFAASCAAIKLVMAFVPESAVSALFCRVPAQVAAFYYHVPLEAETLSFAARGVALTVARPCAATDFFALVASALMTARMLRFGVRAGLAVDLLVAWGATLAVNSLRLIALVPVEAVFPRANLPVFHLLVGVAFFLPAFIWIWAAAFKEPKNGTPN